MPGRRPKAVSSAHGSSRHRCLCACKHETLEQELGSVCGWPWSLMSNGIELTRVVMSFRLTLPHVLVQTAYVDLCSAMRKEDKTRSMRAHVPQHHRKVYCTGQLGWAGSTTGAASSCHSNTLAHRQNVCTLRIGVESMPYTAGMRTRRSVDLLFGTCTSRRLLLSYAPCAGCCAWGMLRWCDAIRGGQQKIAAGTLTAPVSAFPGCAAPTHAALSDEIC